MKSKQRSAFFGVTVVLLVPVFYVLSFGPSMWLADRQVVTMRAIRIAYLPMLVAIKPFHGPRKALSWYLDFWVDQPPEDNP